MKPFDVKSYKHDLFYTMNIFLLFVSRRGGHFGPGRPWQQRDNRERDNRDNRERDNRDNRERDSHENREKRELNYHEQRMKEGRERQREHELEVKEKEAREQETQEQEEEEDKDEQGIVRRSEYSSCKRPRPGETWFGMVRTTLAIVVPPLPLTPQPGEILFYYSLLKTAKIVVQLFATFAFL